MQVIRAKSAGFCPGVKLALRAVNTQLEADAYQLAGQQNAPAKDDCDGATPGRIYTLGPIIHNPLVVGDLAARGVTSEEDVAAINKGDRVVIRAHGVTREIERALREKGAVIVDATCPKVKRAQLAIMDEREKRGGTLLLFGEPDHAEVRGLVSYASHDAVVFKSAEEFEALSLDPAREYYLASQTTQERVIFEEIKERLFARLGREVTVLDTICDTTRRRQQEVIELSDKVEAMVVVGGLNSGNTRRLADVARHQGLLTVHVQNPDDLKPEMLPGVSTVGLTAGASTPIEHLEEAERILLSFP